MHDGPGDFKVVVWKKILWGKNVIIGLGEKMDKAIKEFLAKEGNKGYGEFKVSEGTMAFRRLPARTVPYSSRSAIKDLLANEGCKGYGDFKGKEGTISSCKLLNIMVLYSSRTLMNSQSQFIKQRCTMR